jgi:hypothetical protein
MTAASGHAGVIIASPTAPTTNTDDSALTNLAFYRLYCSTSGSPYPGSTFFAVIQSNTPPLQGHSATTPTVQDASAIAPPPPEGSATTPTHH